MSPFYRTFKTDFKLGQDDIEGIQVIEQKLDGFIAIFSCAKIRKSIRSSFLIRLILITGLIRKKSAHNL